MTTIGNGLLLTIAAGAFTAALAAPAGAANLGCHSLTIGVGGLFNGPQVQSRTLITNTLSSTIAAGTVYTYIVAGRQFTHAAPDPLGPGQTLSLEGGYGIPDGPCSASVPGRKLNIQAAPVNGVLSRS